MIKEEDWMEVDDKPVKLVWPQRAWTKGISPCIGFGLLNRRQRIGRLAHCNPQSTEPEEILDEVLRTSVPEDILVKIAGNVPLHGHPFEEFNEDEEIACHREYERWIINMLLRKGLDPGKVWNCLATRKPITSYTMTVDTRAGRILVAQECMEDDGEDYLNTNTVECACASTPLPPWMGRFQRIVHGTPAGARRRRHH